MKKSEIREQRELVPYHYQNNYDNTSGEQFIDAKFSPKIQNTGLPYLTHARHSFFHTITKKAKLTQNLNGKDKNIQDQLIELEHQRIFHESSNKPNIYEIKYSKKQNKSQKRHKIHLNSTYRKIIMSSRYYPQSQHKKWTYSPKIDSQELKQLNNNTKYNTISHSVERCENQMFRPRMRNIQAGAKKSQVLKNYLSRYDKNNQVSCSLQNKQTKQMMNVTNYSIFNEKRTCQKLQNLKKTLQQRKIQYANKKNQYINKKIPIKLRYKSPQNKAPKIKKQPTFRIENYGPWQNQNPEEEINI